MSLAFSDFKISLDGQAMDAEFHNQLTEILVETDLRQPSMFMLRLRDDSYPQGVMLLADKSWCKLGAAVKISAGEFGDDDNQPQPQTLFEGEVTAIEPDFQANHEAVLIIRGYDKSHRLQRGRKSRTFLDQTDSDVAQKLGREAGLSVEADSTSITHKHLTQHNQTDLEFLLERASRIGYQVYVTGGKLYFKKSSAHQGDGPELEWGENLRTFAPRLSAARQAGTVTVMGWDAKQKTAIKGTATAQAPAHQGGVTGSGGSAVQSAFSAAEDVIVNTPVASQADAKAVAEGLAQALSAAFVQAEGTCLGNPQVQAGKVITIKGVGKKFSGKYQVTAAQHRLNTGSGLGYETTFYITGYEPYTVSQLVSAPANGAAGKDRLSGVVIGVVTNIKDSENDFARIKVKLPWLGEAVESNWARVISPMAGAGRGFYCLPEVGDEVLVAFEHGSIDHPFILGGLWNGSDAPPVAKGEALDSGGGKVNQHIWKSRSGHLILLDDKDGAEKITIKDKTGNNEITIDSSSNKLTIKIGQGGISIETQGAVSLKSSGGDLALEGININLKAKSNCTVEGTAGVTVKNAAAQIALSGPSVNINNGALEVT